MIAQVAVNQVTGMAAEILLDVNVTIFGSSTTVTCLQVRHYGWLQGAIPAGADSSVDQQVANVAMLLQASPPTGTVPMQQSMVPYLSAQDLNVDTGSGKRSVLLFW